MRKAGPNERRSTARGWEHAGPAALRAAVVLALGTGLCLGTVDTAAAFGWGEQQRWGGPRWGEQQRWNPRPYGSPETPPYPGAATPHRAPRALPRRPPPERPLSAAEKAKQEELLARAKQGLLLISISLDNQELTLYANGAEIARSPVSSGTRSHPTPTGIFTVLQKNRHHRSNIYSNAPMPYMQRLTWSGVALHQGVLPGYPASHGCIRLPESFARLLWSATKIGARIVVAREPAAPYEFSHPRLFALKPKPVDQPQPQVQQPVPGAASSGEVIRIAAAGATEELFSIIELRPTLPANAAANAPETPATSPVPAVAVPEGPPLLPPPAAKPLRSGPLSVFVSRKERRLYVRKGFAPVFEVPVTIERPDEPIGTHLFTAMAVNEGGANLRWTGVSTASKPSAVPPPPRPTKRSRKGAEPPPAPAPEAAGQGARDALGRITMAPEVVERITEMMGPGASYMISDHGLGPETGQETDFIIVTR